MPQTFYKRPAAVKDYKFKWTDWLASASTPADTISVSTVTVPVGITLVSQSNTVNEVTVWLSGGGNVLDVKYQIRNRIVTVGGRTEEETIYIIMSDP
jgi:hypothetical protein